jgi:PPK2 family polyphosphate:nucleotide phosphotransferase
MASLVAAARVRYLRVMQLTPVSRRTPLSLDDASAGRPRDLPDDDDALKEQRDRLLTRLGELQAMLYADARYALLIVLQGRDAAGKDGTIRKVFGACNPLGCEVTSFKAPTPIELSHDYLWRVHQAVPAKGMIGIFNRSHYEDVLVVRVKSIVPKPVWSKRYDQINDFERMLDDNRVKILKFFLHISRDEQAKRLRDRLSDPTKNWKFRAGDLVERELWDEYTKAYRDALKQCSTPSAPWYVVPADDKKARNYLIARTVVETLDNLGLRYPPADKQALKLKRKLK